MAQVFRLANDSQDVTYSFLTGNLKPADMIRTPNGDGWYTTTMTLVARTTDANIISAVNTIDELAEANALFWEDQHRAESIWLEESATSETAKRSIIQSIELTPLQVGWFSTMLNKTGALYSLTIIHSAAWENTGLNTASASVSHAHMTLELDPIDGSLPGRISLLQLQGDSDSTSDITTIWGGIKTEDAGSSDFNPIVELETGGLGSTDVTLASDSDYGSPLGTTDNLVQYSPTTDDFKVTYTTLDDAFSSTDYSHWAGDYQVLLRAKLDTAQTVRLRLDWGYKYGTYFKQNEPTYMSSTDYMLFEMGTVSIPPFPRTQNDYEMALFEFQIYAKRIGTASILYLDCLYLIPSNHYFKIEGVALNNASAAYIAAVQTEDNLNYCVNYDTAVNMAARYSPTNFVYPIEGGYFAMAMQHSTIHYLRDEISTSLFWYERFRTHGE